MTVYKKNDKWCVDFYCSNARIRKSGFNTKADADNYKAKMLHNKMYKKHHLPREERIQFGELAKRYLINHSKPNKRSFATDSALIKPLVEYFGSILIGDISREDIDIYRKERLQARIRKGKIYPEGKQISSTTVNRELTLLRSIFNKAIEWNLVFINPAGRLRLAREEPKERVLSEDEMGRLISYSQEPLKGIILVALNTGMRLGEILNLEWSQVSLDNRFVSIKREKSRRLRRIPLNHTMYEFFAQRQLKRGGSDFVFESTRTKKPIGSIRTSWNTLLRNAKIKDLRFHDLRHTFATYSLLKGGDLVSLKEILGHTDIRTTARYAKALVSGQKKLVEGFEVSASFGELIELKKTGHG